MVSNIQQEKHPATIPILIATGVIALLVVIWFLNRGPSVSQVKRWFAVLPPNATRAQVMDVISARHLTIAGEARNEPVIPSGGSIIRVYINCEGDRAIAISIMMRADDRLVRVDVSQGYRGI